MFRLAKSSELPAVRMGAAKLWTARLLVALSVSALPLCAKPSHAATVPAHADLVLMLWQEQFDELQSLANEFRKEKTGFYSGWPNLSLLYERLDSLDGNVTDAVWQEYIAKIEKWQQAFPESPMPRVVLGDTYVKWAW